MPTVTRYGLASGTGWTNVSNLNDADDDVASYTLAAKNTTGAAANITNFDFASVIPVGATINSVQIETRQMVSTTGGVAHMENRLRLGGSVGATNTDSAEPTTLTNRTYPNLARPGGGTWTRADVIAIEAELWARSGNNATSVRRYR